MDVLITGGNGLLGRHLVVALQSRGDGVRVLALPEEDTQWLRERGVKVFRGDVRWPDTLTEPMSGAGAVIHLAGMMGVWRPLQDYRAVNVTGTRNVCRAVLAEGAGRLVHVSSWTVYGMDLGRPARENFLLRPFREPYAITKAEGDLVVQRMIADDHLPAVIIRPGTFFGPGDRLHYGRMADRLRAGRAIIVGRGHNALPFVYVTDVVQGLLLALDRDHAVGQAYNISNDSPLTQQQVLEAIAHDIGARPPTIHVPYRALYYGGGTAEHLASVVGSQRQPVLTRLGVKLFGTDNRHAIDKACRELGYRPQVPVREGLRRAAAWYLAQDQPDPYADAGVPGDRQDPATPGPAPSAGILRNGLGGALADSPLAVAEPGGRQVAAVGRLDVLQYPTVVGQRGSDGTLPDRLGHLDGLPVYGERRVQILLRYTHDDHLRSVGGGREGPLSPFQPYRA
jgi:nucleoside-diphosphate-sugar epimerase